MRPHAGARRAWVALSGGVDSAVAASMALDRDCDVVGVTMRLGVDSAADDAVIEAASRVARTLGIPHRVLDLSDAFADRVVRPFIASYLNGETPNPCVVCNDHVKFGLLLEAALEDGASVLVTGHYARVDATGPRPLLLRGLDPRKDQSYFLYRLLGERLQHIWFPLGDLLKSQVRQIAAARGLPSADRSESQDICFLGDSGIGQLFEERGISSRGGDIVDLAGHVLGPHDGVWRFTVGQRKGIGIGGGPPLYVVAIDADRARVIVGPAEACRVREAHARDVVWDGPETQSRVQAQIRYRAEPAFGVARVDDTTLIVRFDEDVSGVAFGQSLVCYEGDRVLGGGYLTGVS